MNSDCNWKMEADLSKGRRGSPSIGAEIKTSPTSLAKRIVTGIRSLNRHELKVNLRQSHDIRQYARKSHSPRCTLAMMGFGVSGPMYVSTRHKSRCPQIRAPLAKRKRALVVSRANGKLSR